MKKALSQTQIALLLLLPTILVLVVVACYPIMRTLLLSFYKMNLSTGLTPEFIGLANYTRLFSDSRFWQTISNTVIFTFFSLSLELVLGLSGALLLHEKFPLQGAVRAMTILPWALPTAVMALAWSWIFNDSFGVLNDILLRLGMIEQGISWLGKSVPAMSAMILADVWKTTPFMTIIILAGLQAISIDLYEAIQLDGATKWQAFRFVTLPLLKPTLGVALLFRAIAAFGVFDLVFILTGGGPGGTTETVSLYAYTNYFRYLDFGYGATVIVVSFVLLLIIAVLTYRGESRLQ